MGIEFEPFKEFVCVGDTVECQIGNLTFIARIVQDNDYSIDDDDSHNVDQSVTGCSDEQQKKLIAAREAFARGEWFYCGIVVSVKFEDTVIAENAASLWAIEANYPESNNQYLGEVANELLPEAVEVAKNELEKLQQATLDG